MKEKFCPKCGKETEELVEGLCSDCFREENEMEIPGKLEIDICKYCGRIKTGGSWRECSVEEAVEEELKKVMNPEEGVSEIEVSREGGEDNEFKVSVKSQKSGVELGSEGFIEVEPDKGVCETCSGKISGYYEAVLQIRGETGKVRKALNIAAKAMEESRNDSAFVSDVEEVKNGVNLFVGSQSAAKQISRRLSSAFKVERKSSKTLCGQEEGQKKYRSTYLIRILE